MPLFVRKLKVDTTSNHSDGAVPSNSQKVDNESLMTKVQYYERKLGKGFFVSPINTRCFQLLHTLGFFKVKMAIFSTGNALCPVESLIVGVFFLINALNIDDLFIFK